MTYKGVSTVISSSLMFIVQSAFAQTPSLIEEGIPGCSFADGRHDLSICIPSFVAHTIQFLFGFAGGIFITIIMYSGYEIIIGSLPGSSGNEAGKNRITWAIIGFIMSATSFFIMDFIISAIAIGT